MRSNAQLRVLALHSLTPRETQVLKLIGEGKSSKEIGAAFNIRPATIEKHRCRIRTKLGIQGRTGLLRFAITNRFSAIRCPEPLVMELKG
jgi:DNA-binding CsgD family transcriptional regulator